jgi:phosphoribosylformylglycinamidine (FGAM) synthase-like amidotransferase family enzyme
MPHPERASEPMLGSSDGKKIFQSMIESLVLS